MSDSRQHVHELIDMEDILADFGLTVAEFENIVTDPTVQDTVTKLGG
jgi:hypothetical protein